MAQADGVVANGTGSAVRTDINNQYAALWSNHSGSTEPSSGKVAYQFWADTNTSILKIRNSANNAWINLFTLAGGIDVDAASNFNEDVTFVGDSSKNLVWDKSDGALEFADNAKAVFGNSDLEIYHSGTASYIVDNGSGDLILRASDQLKIQDTDNGEDMAIFNKNGAIELFYNNSQKFLTTANGIKALGSANTGEIGVFHATGGSFTSATVQSVASRNTTNESYSHFKCSINGVADKLFVRDSGDVDNTNGSYGSISDVSLKENIVDAGSQWDDIKNIRIRKFNFKDTVDPNKPTLIGVVAQEVEIVCPNLVKTSKSMQGGEEKDYKSFKYSVLYMKAIKALQEAMAKIETLETKVAALES